MFLADSISRFGREVVGALLVAVGRLDKSFKPSDTIDRLRRHNFTWRDSIYIFHVLNAIFWLTVMQAPPFPYKLAIPILYAIALLIPFTSQFFVPATPIFAWLLTFYSNQFLAAEYRPEVHVVLLPTLESVLYGANISDILTRFTHPVLDVLAWIPYGVVHYTFPLVLSALIWLFKPPLALRTWATTFGYMNLTAVVCQIVIPCAAPWYELIYGLTPAKYGTPGSAGGLARIDALFGSDGYAKTFGASPLVFGAFPSLHAGWATLEALFLSHFWPRTARYAWAYAGVLYWATMYLSHHYLIDVVGGGCLAMSFFYLLVPEELRADASGVVGAAQGAKYEQYDLENRRTRRMSEDDEFGSGSDVADWGEEREEDIMFRSPNPRGAAGGSQSQGEGSGKAANGSADPQKGTSSGDGKSHKHTASIASLIRADKGSAEETWSPIGSSGFVFPPASSGEGRR
ncbi:PAP2-domain-containing protein [Coniophora puteana RWD-64-598 SS2]|uniref:PAP2-domain-containing protein n=1 Tax=Coniophora puteana (strain RWD-64-598) TaxID=741705 RepID=A0A5M3MFY8_CONPW|nr:PAP2-domain-containing protein [Coniophora puteana RWD-64-598 SS2]EIW77957.1 PAP2-domain-containing protein [Coniophora puteana RWD-64-598 SS2]